MQHSEEAAAEAEAESNGAFRLEGEGSVVELELFQRVAQVGVLAAVLGVNAAVDHSTGRAVAGQSIGAGLGRIGDGVAHLSVGNIFDACGEVSDIAGAKLGTGFKSNGTHMSDLKHLVACSGGF